MPSRRPRRHSHKPALMGNHQRCWIWGRAAVIETLRAGRWMPLELHLAETLAAPELDTVVRLAERSDVPVQIDAPTSLERLCRSAEHQGFVAKMPPFPYDLPEEILASPPSPAFYAISDGIQDPFNLGAILRSAEALGVDAFFLGEANQVEVNSLVVRASAGAVSHLRIARTSDLASLVARLKEAGVTVIGTTPGARRAPSEIDLRGPTAFLLGNEAHGIRPEILALCDVRAAIRQSGHVGSLNAAVAAGILFYEVRRQRDGMERPPAERPA